MLVDVRQVFIDGVRQVYRVAGDGPVCLVHPGGPGIDPGYLRFPELEKALTLVYLDPIGSGDSDLLPGGDYSMSRYVDFAAGVMDDLGVREAYFLGHSHGGFVGLQFGLDKPERVTGLILYDTAPLQNEQLWAAATEEMEAFARRWPGRPEAVEAARVWKAAKVDHTLKVADDESHKLFLAAILPAYFADYRKTAEEVGADLALGVRHDPNRLPVDWDVRDRLHAIGVPALIIAGTYDFVCPLRFSRLMRDVLPQGRLRELAHSGHFGHLEQPEEFTEAVVEFVNETERMSIR
ncbi:alpha/beta fold hydrolase [Amycolatopsis sp. NPDC004368]